jgi:hypothetical protein
MLLKELSDTHSISSKTLPLERLDVIKKFKHISDSSKKNEFWIISSDNCTHLFCLDPVTTAVWLFSFDLIILSILRRTVTYASSIHNNLDCL